MALDFLKALGGDAVLTAMVPDGANVTRTFRPDQRNETARFILEAVRARKNLYYTFNVPRGTPTKKVTKADIVEARGLHTDLDPADGETVEDAKPRLRRELGQYEPPPSAIIDTGAGLQALWLAASPVAVDSDQLRDELEARNRAIEHALDADACHNADRILRLPGTINFPNKTKREKKGRDIYPTSLVALNLERRYDLATFPMVSGAKPKGGGVDIAECERNLRAGINWHNNMRDATAHLAASKRDSEIITWALQFRMESYTEADTRADVARMIKIARDKFKIPEPKAEAPATAIKRTPAIWRPEAEIEKRHWLYANHYIRKFATATIAPGGIGKSSLLLAEAIAMASGKNLLHYAVDEPLRVWYWNGEDPLDELERRFRAVCKHLNVTEDDLGGRLFINSGRTTPIIIAEEERSGTTIRKAVVDKVIEAVNENVDVLMIDPFIETHLLNENDNSAINQAARQWQRIADECNCSVELSHHTRKLGNNQSRDAEPDADTARGASALIGAVRSARVLNRMTAQDGAAIKLKPTDSHRRYFCIGNGKANLAPPVDKADWYRIESVKLTNGDNVGVVTRWTYPDALTVDERAAVLAAIRKGEWLNSPRSPEWVGAAIAKGLGLKLANPQSRKRVNDVLDRLMADGTLEEVEGKNAKSQSRTYVKVADKSEI